MASTITWDARLAAVAGKDADKVEKAFGLHTVGDLLGHYPRRYVAKGSLTDLGELEPRRLHQRLRAGDQRARRSTYQDRRTRRTAYRTEVARSRAATAASR